MDKIFNISNRTYDFFKWFVTVGFPAFIACFAGISEIVHYDKGTMIVAIMSLINTMFGAWLGVSSTRYWESKEE